MAQSSKLLSKYDFEKVIHRMYFSNKADQKREYVRSFFDNGFEGYGMDARTLSWDEVEDKLRELLANSKDILEESDEAEVEREFRSAFGLEN